jgi:hypothetical protein
LALWLLSYATRTPWGLLVWKERAGEIFAGIAAIASEVRQFALLLSGKRRGEAYRQKAQQREDERHMILVHGFSS